MTGDIYGQYVSISWTPPEGLTVSTAEGAMFPDRVDASWILAPGHRGPERGKVMCWGRPKNGPVSHTFWGYGGVMADSPDWVHALSASAYGEAHGEGAADPSGFTRVAASRSRFLERRFMLEGAPPTASYLAPRTRFVPLSGMSHWSLGSGEPDRSSMMLWGNGHEASQYANAADVPAWLAAIHDGTRTALESAPLPPGWENHQPLLRPERRPPASR